MTTSFLHSQVQVQSEDFKLNFEANQKLVSDCEALLQQVKAGGGSENVQRHRQQGKLFVRDRLALLLDKGSWFLEVGILGAHGVYHESVPAAGVVAGIGLVHGRAVMVIANDATVKGGTYFPLTVKKHLRAQEIALENALPCVYLVDSGGAFLPLQADVFPDKEHFGRIFYNQAQMSARGIPQIAAVMGSCTAGGAYVPAMSDQTVIVQGTGTIFLGGPPLVKAATGEDVTAEYLGGAKVHTEISGVADHFAENDEHALAIVRDIVGTLGASVAAPASSLLGRCVTPQPPAYDPGEILGLWPRDLRRQVDVREIIARLVDGSRLFEFKKNYGATLVTGFAHIEGMPCGIVANNGVLFSESSLKAAHFIELCCAEKTPLLFLQNVTGFMVGSRAERGGIAKDGAKMVHAVANAAVPKVTLLMGGSFGAGNYGMCGRAFGPRFLWSWPSSRISVMGGEQAAQVMLTVKREQRARRDHTPLLPEEEAAIADPIRSKYEKEGHPFYASARLWDDGVIGFLETRRVLALSLATALGGPVGPTRFGVFRM